MSQQILNCKSDVGTLNKKKGRANKYETKRRFVDGSIIYCFVLTRHGVDGVEGDGLEVDGLADGVGDALVANDVAEAPDLLNSLASSMLSTQLLRGSIV